MKSTLLQAGIIIGASVVIALVYNAVSSKPLDLVYTPIELDSADDSSLFEDTRSSLVDTTAVITPKDTVVQNPQVAVKDTAKPDKTSVAQNENGQSETPPAGQEKVKPKNVKYDQVLRLSKDPSVVFIDARNAEEFALGHIGNAKNYYTPEFQQHIPEILQIDREKRVVVYCGGGACELSHEMADHLINFGFTRVFVYTGGWEEWKKKQSAQ